MSSNDKSLKNPTGASYADIANPTVDTNPHEGHKHKHSATHRAGAGSHSERHRHEPHAPHEHLPFDVIEARPGIIETTNIDPLNENSNKDDGWANVKSTARTATPKEEAGKGFIAATTGVVTGGAQLALGTLTGDQDARKAGSEAIFGKSE